MAAEIISLFDDEGVLFDTSFYISRYRYGFYGEIYESFVQKTLLFLHVVVFEELLVGMLSQKEKEDLYELKGKFEEGDMIITPNQEDWESTGLILNRVLRGKQLNAKQTVSITHDVLIAVSCGRKKLRLVTENKKDFEMIQRYCPFKLTLLNPSNAHR